MKLNRRDLRRLIESMINEDNQNSNKFKLEEDVVQQTLTGFFGYINYIKNAPAGKDLTAVASGQKLTEPHRKYIKYIQDNNIQISDNAIDNLIKYMINNKPSDGFYYLDKDSEDTLKAISDLFKFFKDEGFEMDSEVDLNSRSYTGLSDAYRAGLNKGGNDYYKLPRLK